MGKNGKNNNMWKICSVILIIIFTSGCVFYNKRNYKNLANEITYTLQNKYSNKIENIYIGGAVNSYWEEYLIINLNFDNQQIEIWIAKYLFKSTVQKHFEYSTFMLTSDPSRYAYSYKIGKIGESSVYQYKGCGGADLAFIRNKYLVLLFYEKCATTQTE